MDELNERLMKMHNLKTIIEIAQKTKVKLKGKMDFVSVEEYLKKFGYKVIFFNTPNGDMELDRFNLKEKAKLVRSFVYITKDARRIFIDNNASAEDKRYLLYHSAGHILLGHMDYPRITTISGVKIDFEASVFAFALLNEE